MKHTYIWLKLFAFYVWTMECDAEAQETDLKASWYYLFSFAKIYYKCHQHLVKTKTVC